MNLNKNKHDRSLVQIGATGICGDLDKGSDCTNPLAPGHTYLEVYDILFKPYGKFNINLLEIGFQYGPSIRLWWEYFDKSSNIFGIDICDNCSVDKAYKNIKECAFPDPTNKNKNENFDNIWLNEVDSHEPEEFIKELNKKEIKFDIIIDDGWHSPLSNTINFQNFIHHLHKDGIYVVEDMNIDGSPKEVVDNLKKIGYKLQIVDMSNYSKPDNILGIYYHPAGNHASYFDNFMNSKIWTTDEKFSIEYSIKKQNELLSKGIKPWNPHEHHRNREGSNYPTTKNKLKYINV